MPKHINTYHKGMDRDSSPNNYGEGRYYDARNFRRLSENDMSAGAMNNMLGNTFKKTLPNEYLVIGSCPIRDLTVIFATKCTTDNPGGVDPDLSADPSSLGRIYTTNLNDAVPTLTLIKEDYYNFTTKHPIYAQAIGRYERSTLQKVYWVDGFNLFRGMNLSDPPTNPDQIDIVPSVSFSQPYMTNTGSGELKVGRIQFAYQLYNLSGAESKFSPASPLYNLTNSNLYSTTDVEFEGTNKLDDAGDLKTSGMSVTVTIDNIDTNYDKIKLVSVHYNTVDSTPSINIVSIKDVSSSMTIIDTGVYDLGSMTLNEFRTLGGLLIIPKTIDVKDNMLFAANIKTKYFDVDFDARAYRWRTTDNIAHILDVGSSYDTYDKVSGSWPTATYAFKGVTNDLIPEDHNCINPFNYDPVSNTYMESSSYTANWAACKYQSDNATLGGEGPNVRYSFGNDKLLHADSIAQPFHKIEIDKGAILEGNNPEEVGNPIGSYVGYSNPYKAAHYLGYKRDEIYRFGVVFLNNKGQESFVKWIGDIRTPTIKEVSIIYGSVGKVYSQPLYIFFEIDTSSLSDDVFGYRIVRTKREQKDKTIILSGAISHTQEADVALGFKLRGTTAPIDSNDCICPVMFPREKAESSSYNRKQTIHTLITPEESYYRNFAYSSEDYIKLAGKLDGRYYEYVGSNAGSGYHTSSPSRLIFSGSHAYSVHKYSFLNGLTTQPTYSVNEARSFAPRRWQDIQSPGYPFGVSSDDFINFAVAKSDPLPTYRTSQKGGNGATSIVIDTDAISDSLLSGGDDYKLYYVDYKRNNANAIYGGIEYTDRELNEYIPAGNYIDLTRLKGTDTGGANLKIYDASIIDLYPVGSLVGGVVINLDTGLSGDITVHAASELTTTIFFNNNSYLIIPPKMNLTYVFGGDTYVSMFDVIGTSFNAEDAETSGTSTVLYYSNNASFSQILFPCEMSVNIDIDNGWTYSKNSSNTFGVHREVMLQEENGTYFFNGISIDYTLIQDKDMYLYNSAYSQQDTSKIFLSKPSDWVEITESDTTIMQSDVKVNNEQIDSWLKFRTENYIDVENSYGPINRLLRWNNYMIFFQDIGVGTVSINERQLIPIENNSALELGRGGVLDRFDMIATGIGCRHKEAVLATEFGFYWYDVQKKAMYYYSNALQNISDVAGLFSEFKNIPDTFYDHTNTIDGNGIMLTKNKRYDEVWLSFVESAGYNDTFIYNEMFKQFIGSTDHDAKIFLNTTRGLFALKNMRDIYEENTGNYGQFFGSTYNSTLTLIINPNGDIVDVFNNFNFLSDLHDSGGTEVIDETFTDVQQLNSYQDSGVVSFVVPTNIRRRMRTWRFNDMRDSSARFRDSYLKMILRFTNSSNRKFVMHPMNTIYIVPAESITP